ncbi:hypothetical protein KAJ83_02510 [Marivibrio halodurans]|uniref:DUF2946 domain-containing protein n=1 Tax=Marivibrio halodurans TaxID=2039722 RepID=A0A8J7S387_9PROT|nr:hypothetical protein [Marivibrio halodurans]MBP5855864.1 hypothetical protein [Marivibrio halodurans]
MRSPAPHNRPMAEARRARSGAPRRRCFKALSTLAAGLYLLMALGAGLGFRPAVPQANGAPLPSPELTAASAVAGPICYGAAQPVADNTPWGPGNDILCPACLLAKSLCAPISVPTTPVAQMATPEPLSYLLPGGRAPFTVTEAAPPPPRGPPETV